MQTDTYHLHRRAHARVLRALRGGRLVREPCEWCGSSDSEAHHDDYNRPLEVMWLCRTCHRARDRYLKVTRTRKQSRRKDLLSPAEVGRVVGLKTRTITRWCREGKIDAVKIGRVWRIHRDTIQKIMGRGL